MNFYIFNIHLFEILNILVWFLPTCGHDLDIALLLLFLFLFFNIVLEVYYLYPFLVVYITCPLYFGANAMWYLHLQLVYDKVFLSMKASLFNCACDYRNYTLRRFSWFLKLKLISSTCIAGCLLFCSLKWTIKKSDYCSFLKWYSIYYCYQTQYNRQWNIDIFSNIMPFISSYLRRWGVDLIK